MTEIATGNGDGTRLAWWLRALLAAFSCVFLVLLGIAWNLTPSLQGSGTHQQLGLPPCTFIVLWGIPCPMCGMTTSWAHLVRGELVESFRASVGGALLGLTAALAVPGCAYFAYRGLATRNEIASRITAGWLVFVTAVITIQWIIRLAY